MIFYFSGTGNSRWAAIQIGAATQERLINIADYSDYLSADKAIEPFARSWLESAKTGTFVHQPTETETLRRWYFS